MGQGHIRCFLLDVLGHRASLGSLASLCKLPQNEGLNPNVNHIFYL